jgi:dolichyl-phosphate beta-glucosyltransferase
MAEESWIGTCVHCTKLLASVPLPVLLVAVSATLLGSFVLVCSPLGFLSSYPNVWC